ncbi:hypothetical protein SDC9_189628 [bioreactor metagenome]|uniref:Uncharacterized protein n=1 Tax=bioreactor metagenome TaxID=1076179 RepID=A0A645HUC4_9ZZZZ
MLRADIPFGDAKRFLSDRNGAVILSCAVEFLQFLIEIVPFDSGAARVRDGGHPEQQGECEGEQYGASCVLHAISFHGAKATFTAHVRGSGFFALFVYPKMYKADAL